MYMVVFISPHVAPVHLVSSQQFTCFVSSLCSSSWTVRAVIHHSGVIRDFRISSVIGPVRVPLESPKDQSHMHLLAVSLSYQTPEGVEFNSSAGGTCEDHLLIQHLTTSGLTKSVLFWCVVPPQCQGMVLAPLELLSTPSSSPAGLLSRCYSSSLGWCPVLLHPKCRIQHLSLFCFTLLMIFQCSKPREISAGPLVPRESQQHLPCGCPKSSCL